MNHDIAHCKGFKCQLRNSCLRYAAHRDLLSHRNHRLRDRVGYIPPYLCVNNDLYIPFQNNNKQ